MNAPNGDRYRRRYPNPEQWPSNVVFGLYAEVVTEKRVNELSREWLDGEAHAVVDAATRILIAEAARQQRRATAQAEGWIQGEPGE